MRAYVLVGDISHRWPGSWIQRSTLQTENILRSTKYINIRSTRQRSVKQHENTKCIQLSHLLKIDLLKLKQFAIVKRLMLDFIYLAISYRRRVHDCLGISESSILNVLLSDGFGILIKYLHLRRIPRRGRLTQQMLSYEELLIVLRLQITFERDQTAGRDRLFGHLCCMVCMPLYGYEPTAVSGHCGV